MGAFGSGGIFLMWKINICMSICYNLTLLSTKMVSQTCTKARLTSLSLLPAKVAWPEERWVEEHEDEEVGRRSL